MARLLQGRPKSWVLDPGGRAPEHSPGHGHELVNSSGGSEHPPQCREGLRASVSLLVKHTPGGR